jgi:hypothetical protein
VRERRGVSCSFNAQALIFNVWIGFDKRAGWIGYKRQAAHLDFAAHPGIWVTSIEVCGSGHVTWNDSILAALCVVRSSH